MREANRPVIVRSCFSEVEDLRKVAATQLAEAREAGTRRSRWGRNELIRYKKLGTTLLKIKERVGRGNWLPWIKASGLCQEQEARNYMQIAEHWGVVEGAKSLRQALKILRESDESEEQNTSGIPDQIPNAPLGISTDSEVSEIIETSRNGQPPEEGSASQPEAARATPNRLPLKERVFRDLDNAKNRQAKLREEVFKLKSSQQLDKADMDSLRDKADAMVRESEAFRKVVYANK